MISSDIPNALVVGVLLAKSNGRLTYYDSHQARRASAGMRRNLLPVGAAKDKRKRSGISWRFLVVVFAISFLQDV